MHRKPYQAPALHKRDSLVLVSAADFEIISIVGTT
jgi:hypothetical protein